MFNDDSPPFSLDTFKISTRSNDGWSSCNCCATSLLSWSLTRRNYKTSEMWCSHIHDSFKKILEKNPEILSKNRYITICEKLYEGNKVHAHLTNYIYCSIYDFLVFISETVYSIHFYYNSHLKRCIFENTILNKHARRKEILQFIDRKKFQIWQYK